MRQFNCTSQSLGTLNQQRVYLRMGRDKALSPDELSDVKSRRELDKEAYCQTANHLKILKKKVMQELRSFTKEDINPKYLKGLKAIIAEYDHPWIRFTNRKLRLAQKHLFIAKKYKKEKDLALDKMLKILSKDNV